MSELRFDGKVAIITGAGNGLGRAHALLFGSRGCKVVVNDLGGAATGGGQSSAAADRVVAEIKAAGGEAVANYNSVEDGDKIVQSALDAFGRVDIVVNNAGILRDMSFRKMTHEDWDLVYRVHVLGAMRVTHAAWPHLIDQGYGRVLFTASAAGIYGNFGQANYSMAKLGLAGLSNTLAIEGKKKNVLVNTIAPLAGSRLTETVLPKELLDALKPEYVSPLVAWLAHESCTETGGLYEVGGGFFAKLRWERSVGRTWRLGRTITPEGVKGAWEDIAGFAKTTHPTGANESFAPIMENVQAGPTKGGNELIDVDAALGYEFPEYTTSHDERDAVLYALGVGGGANPTDDRALQLVYENHGEGQKVLPTFGVIPAVGGLFKMAKDGVQAPGMNFGFERILHGEQYLELLRPIPTKATLRHKMRIKEIWDKGKGAVVVNEVKSFDEQGELVMRNEVVTFVRGAGGFGGERGPSVEVNVPPERAPDAVATQKTQPDQALLYRLTGDWNPLHADPNFAGAMGFEKPILHGLCSFGFAARHVIEKFAPNGDPRFFKNIKARFSEVVYPGETLVTEMWKESALRIVFRTRVKERDKLCITAAAIELYEAIPTGKAVVTPVTTQAAAAPAPVSAEVTPNSADVFAGIGKYFAQTDGLAKKVATVYLWKLKSPESVWTMDLKNGAGSVASGETQKADCTLELADADFMDMCTGKADPQKLYFGGKLKISGNIMASQKLEFLRKLDPAIVMEAARARVAAGGSAAPAAVAPSPAQTAPAVAVAPDAAEPTIADWFGAVRVYLEEHADIPGKVGASFHFKLKNPDSAWTIDLKGTPWKVAEGLVGAADCTLDLSNADFVAMTKGAADPQKLYFAGKLKLSGNVMAAQKLQFITKIDRATVDAALQKVRGDAPAPAPASPAAPAPAPATTASSGGSAAAIFTALGQRLAQNPALQGEVQGSVRFQLREGGVWLADLSAAPGRVVSSNAGHADVTLVLGEEELAAIVADPGATFGLYMQGKVRVDGDVRFARRLGFLKGLA